MDSTNHTQGDGSIYDPYTVLGLSKNTSVDEIKTAYKKLALKHHPDKAGGDATTFNKINEAYQILNDPDKRRLYDSCHEDSINLEVLSKFASILMNIVKVKFQERMANSNEAKQKQSSKVNDVKPKLDKSAPVVIKVNVDIEDLYNARVKKIVVKVKRRETSGVFGYSSVPLYISLLNFKPQYTFSGVGDDGEIADTQRGDVIVKLNIESKIIPLASLDTLFCRNDINIEKSMSLYEYLYGLDANLEYFNGEVLHIICKPLRKECDDYYSYVHVIHGKGLPYIDQQSEEEDISDKNDLLRGDLYIYFKLHILAPPKDIMEENENIFKSYFNATPSKQDE